MVSFKLGYNMLILVLFTLPVDLMYLSFQCVILSLFYLSLPSDFV